MHRCDECQQKGDLRNCGSENWAARWKRRPPLSLSDGIAKAIKDSELGCENHVLGLGW